MEIDAIDLASVCPPWFEASRHRGIQFLSGVRMEDLPFSDASYDRVFSQFGLEYSNMARALAEAMRVSRPGAEMAFVMHSTGSVLFRVGREEVTHYGLLRRENGLLQAARGVIPWIRHVRSGGVPSQAATQARKLYNDAMLRVGEVASASSAPDLLIEARDVVHSIVAGKSDTALQRLDDYSAELAKGHLRSQEMLDRALGSDEAQALVALLESMAPDCHVKLEALRQEEGILGWALSAVLAR